MQKWAIITLVLAVAAAYILWISVFSLDVVESSVTGTHMRHDYKDKAVQDRLPSSLPTAPRTSKKPSVPAANLSMMPAKPTPTSTASTSPRPLPPYRLLSTDFHIATIGDVKDVVSKHVKGVVIRDLSLSGACGRTGTCATADQLKVLQQGDVDRGIYASSEYKRQFFSAYSDGAWMSQFDAVICMHPSGMCEFYMPFNLTMILYPTTRFEQGRESNQQRLSGFITNFRSMAARPGNVVWANNLYDVHYAHYFTGITPRYVPSMCTYISAKWSWKAVDPVRKTVIPVHGFRPKKGLSEGQLHEFLSPLQRAGANRGIPFQFGGFREVLGENYSYESLAQHPAVLYIPYQVSVMSFYEQYRMGIPILAPSLELLTTWHMDYLMVSERTWDTVLASAPRHGSAVPRHPDADEPYDPNDEFTREAVRWWLQWADFYHFPHVILFDSWEGLVNKLAKVDLEAVSKAQLEFSAKQEAEVAEVWREFFRNAPRQPHGNLAGMAYEQRMDSIYGPGNWSAY